jgi:hypothetical protein
LIELNKLNATSGLCPLGAKYIDLIESAACTVDDWYQHKHTLLLFDYGKEVRPSLIARDATLMDPGPRSSVVEKERASRLSL